MHIMLSYISLGKKGGSDKNHGLLKEQVIQFSFECTILNEMGSYRTNCSEKSTSSFQCQIRQSQRHHQ